MSQVEAEFWEFVARSRAALKAVLVWRDGPLAIAREGWA